MNTPILIICTSLNMGGSEKQAVWLANSLSNKNYKVIFVSLKDVGILISDLNSNVIVKNFKIVKARNYFGKIYYFLIGIYKLLKIIRIYQINVCVSFLFHSNLIGRLITLFSKRKIKHIVCVRSDRLSKRSSKKSFSRNLIFNKLIINKSTITVFNSMMGYNNFNYLNCNKKIIFNVPLNKPKLFPTKNNKLIYLGRLDELKNIKNLIKAVNIIHKSKKIEIDIFGKGPDLNDINFLIQKFNLQSVVKMLSIDKDISNKLNLYSGLILASTHEAFPNVIIEAMNSRTIPISTRVGDAPYLLKDGRGILIDGFEPENIADSIMEFLNLTDKEKIKIESKGYEFIRQNFTENNVLLEWINIIESID